jgi:hypothetical protein
MIAEEEHDVARSSTARHNTPISTIARLLNAVVMHYTRSWTRGQWIGFSIGCLIAGVIMVWL